MHHSALIFGILFTAAFVVLLVSSQLFWIGRVRGLLRRLIPSRTPRRWVGLALLAYVALWLFEIASFFWSRTPTATFASARTILIDGPLNLWIFGSVIGYLLVLILRLPGNLFRLGRWMIRQAVAFGRPVTPREALPGSSRRDFLRTATTAAGTLPFWGGFYGMVFGRTELEITHKRVPLARLPRAFEGFRIVQLSDVHIGPFMTTPEIHHVVDTAMREHGDLIVLGGDYVTWDPTSQGAAVQSLAGLRAPFGIYGCLGNHEAWTGVSDSITRLFTAQGVHILRQQNASLRSGGDDLNLIGVDFQSNRPAGRHAEGLVRHYLEGVEPLVRRDTVNILLSHNPNTFDRAAQMGIDLSLAGHTHGGQVALEFISPQLSPSRLITPYVAGWFSKPGGALYVNRGLGTIGPPIRWGAPPEITVFELSAGK